MVAFLSQLQVNARKRCLSFNWLVPKCVEAGVANSVICGAAERGSCVCAAVNAEGRCECTLILRANVLGKSMINKRGPCANY